MKVIRDYGEEMTLEEFADKYDLTLVIKRRRRSEERFGAYYASFDRVEIKRGSILEGTFGNGPTPRDAVCDYARLISDERLVYNAYDNEKRRGIQPTRIIGEWEDDEGVLE
jgi:hypothetical protein